MLKVVCCSMLTGSAFLTLQAAVAIPPPYYIGEIFPTPKKAVYRNAYIPVYDIGAKRPLAAIVPGKTTAQRLAARDLAERVLELAGVPTDPDALLGTPNAIPEGKGVICIGGPSANSATQHFVQDRELAVSPRPKGEQGYLIRSVRMDGRWVCIGAGGGPMGDCFAAMALLQLLTIDAQQRVVLRAARVDDWPGFELRGSCCYTPEEARWLALARFSTLDDNYGKMGVNAWRDPDGNAPPADWGVYSGAGHISVSTTPDGVGGPRILRAEIASWYEGFADRPHYISAAVMLGDSNGYTGKNALPAAPGAYRLTFRVRGDVPKVVLSVTTWRDGEAASGQRGSVPVKPSESVPSQDWHDIEARFVLPAGIARFAPQFRVMGQYSDGFRLGQKFELSALRLVREKGGVTVPINSAFSPGSSGYSQGVAELWNWAVPRGLWPVQYVNPLNVTGWEDDGARKIQVSDPKQIDDLARTFRISLGCGGRWVMLALDDFASRLGGPAPWYVITNKADRKAFRSLGECHGTLVRELYQRLKKTTPDLRMIACPAYYWTPSSNYRKEGEKYLREFGRLVPPDVLIVWTGPRVRSRRITAEQVEYFTQLIGRKPYLWDNTIYARHNPPLFMLDPFDSSYPANMSELLEGGLHNNGGVTEIYKVGCLEYGEYAWNPGTYDAKTAEEKALRMVLGNDDACVRAARTFRDSFYALRDPHPDFVKGLGGVSKDGLPEKLGPLTRAQIDALLHKVTRMREALTVLRKRSRNRALVTALEGLLGPVETAAGKLPKTGDLLETMCVKDGKLILEEWAFVGGAGHATYANQCPARRATWIYGKKTPNPAMRTTFRLDEIPAGDAVLILDGQDCNKGKTATPVEVRINDAIVHAGPDGCRKRGWSEWRLHLPDSALHTGDNTLEIRNMTDSDSNNSDWFMLHQARIEWGGNKR